MRGRRILCDLGALVSSLFHNNLIGQGDDSGGWAQLVLRRMHFFANVLLSSVIFLGCGVSRAFGSA